jgi:hypothetical protein
VIVYVAPGSNTLLRLIDGPPCPAGAVEAVVVKRL